MKYSDTGMWQSKNEVVQVGASAPQQPRRYNE